MTLATVRRYRADAVGACGDHAVVVGASMAGLLAARVLADAFETVTVVERDALPDAAVPRRGVPQSRQIHALLTAASATLADLFPGFAERLLDGGGLLLDSSGELRFFLGGDYFAPAPTRLPFYSASRPLIERVVRERLAAVDGVRLRPGTSFVDYVVDDGGRTVEGVTVRGEAGADEVVIDADLVVDATGRTSRTPRWLEAHGFAAPPLDEVRIDMAYSTALVERPPDDRRAYIVPPTPPNPRGGTVLPIEGDRWLVGLNGFHGNHPPTDPEGFAAFAASLPVPAVAEVFEGHPLAEDDINAYPYPSDRRYRYESLEAFPAGLLVVGDAVASFNPIYAQGMSVAALEALQLHHALAEGGLVGLAPRFFERAARVVDTAWSRAAGSDFQYPETTGSDPGGGNRFVDWYSARLVRRAHTDGRIAEAMTRVTMMETEPTSLFSPGVVWRALRPG